MLSRGSAFPGVFPQESVKLSPTGKVVLPTTVRRSFQVRYSLTVGREPMYRRRALLASNLTSAATKGLEA